MLSKTECFDLKDSEMKLLLTAIDWKMYLYVKGAVLPDEDQHFEMLKLQQILLIVTTNYVIFSSNYYGSKC